MKGIEKKQLHLLLQKAEALYSKCPTPFSIQKIPEYQDDNLKNNSIPITTQKEITATFKNLSSNILSCKRCSLNNETRFIGTGLEKPLVLVILDSKDEDNSESNKLLLKMISAINLFTDKNCYITSLIKCVNQNNQTFQLEQINACMSFFDAQLSIQKPTLILGFGEITAQSLLNTKESINQLRGKFFEYKNIPLIFTYHPKDLLNNTALKSPAWADLKTVKAKLESLDKQNINHH